MISNQFFVMSSPSLVDLLHQEMQLMDIVADSQTQAGILVTGSLEQAYRLCLWSRLASRVLLQIHQGDAKGEKAFYEQIQRINWSSHFDVNRSFAISCFIVRSKIHNTHYAALLAKDAIVDQFREHCGERPSVDKDSPDIHIYCYLFKNKLTISLDLSGQSLHRRGYRTEAGLAPLKETLAAGLLYRANWPAIAANGGSLVDPLCGSGTFLIEAAMMAADIAPGLLRARFGFDAWQQHQPEIFKRLREQALAQRELGLKKLPSITGFDANQKMLPTALANIKRATLEGYITVKHLGLADGKSVDHKPGLLICNPPYGKRVSTANKIPTLYKNLGRLIKHKFSGWRIGILLAERNLDYELGLTAQQSYALKNGALQCFFQDYGIVYSTQANTGATQKILSVDTSQSAGMQALANRLRKNINKTSKWANKNNISCYRVYDADIPEYAFAIDLYTECDGDQAIFLQVQEYQAPKHIDVDKVSRHVNEALHVIADVFDIKSQHIHLKKRKRQKGSEQYARFDDQRNFHVVEESGLKFLVNVTDYLDTGLFLDHRPIRKKIFELAQGKHFLNLFCYTSTASVYAAKAGALSTLSVDMSNTYLNWSKENFKINRLGFAEHHFEQADCLSWLDAAETCKTFKNHFDLVFIDPPTFSNSKKMHGVLDIQRDYGKILNAAKQLLAENGQIIFSTNYRDFNLQRDELDFSVLEDISTHSIPFDFVRNKKIHRCWILQS